MRVDFLLTNPLLVDHFGPVVAELARRGHAARLVPLEPHPDYPLLAESFDEEQRILAACEAAAVQAGLPFGRCDPRAEVVVTALSTDHVQPWRGRRLKFRYGVGLLREGFHYRPERVAGFDGLLLHGDFEVRVFATWADPARMRTMGMPRHDAALREGPGRDAARARIGMPEEGSGPVVGYFPTWGEHAGIARFAGPLDELASSHRIVIKAHALTGVRASEDENLRTLRGLKALHVAADHPLVDVLRACDVVIADAKSGVGPEAVLLAPDVPLVLTSTQPASAYFDELAALGTLVQEPTELLPAVTEALRRDPLGPRRRSLADLFFAERSGGAAARAADAILELAALPALRPGGRWKAWRRRLRGLLRGGPTA